jgi:nucleoprotein TPR
VKLKDQLEVVNNELQTSNRELSQIRQQEDEKHHSIEQENAALQTEIARLKDVEEKALLSQGFYQEDLRQQADIAQEAQRNYEREVMKHAEAAQLVQNLREEIGNLRTEVRTLRTEAETATAVLQSSESSWDSQKSEYERELRDLRARADDLVKQNTILHQQFENVTSQAQQIRDRTESNINALEASVSSQEAAAGKEDSIEGLREVIKYLRREKEIIDIKHEMLQQENRRLKQQLDRTATDLDETRVLLMSEREKEASAATSSAQHQELLAKINEINLLRESNVTLRSENERNTRRAAQLESKVSQLAAQISPLEENVRVLQAENGSKDEQMRLLVEDNERWKNRNQQILQKYERIDPVELQNLKDQLAAVDTEKERLDTQLADAISKNRAVADAWKAKHDRAVASAKTRLDQNRELIEGLEAKVNTLEKENAGSSSQAETVRTEAEAAKKELKEQITVLQAQIDELRRNTQPLAAADGSTWETEKQGLEESIKQKDAEITRITGLARGAERAKVFNLISKTNGQRETATKVVTLEEEVKTLKEQIAQSSAPSAKATDEDFEQRVNEAVQQRLSSDTALQVETMVQQQLVQAEQDKQRAIADAVRATQEAADAQLSELSARKDKELAEVRSSAGQVDVDARIAEAIKAREAELKEIHEQEVKAAADAAFKRFKQPSTEKIIAAGIKHGEKLFNERWEKFQKEQAASGGTSIPQEVINKAVEEATKKKDDEFAEKMQKAMEGAKNEAEMRNKLQLGKLQKQVNDGKAKIELYEKQYGPLPPVAQPSQQHPTQTPQTAQPQEETPIIPSAAVQPTPLANVLSSLQRGRGGIPRPGRGGNAQGVGRGSGPGQGRGQRLSGQLNSPQQGQRPAVNRPVAAGSPTGGPGQQRRQSGQQQQQQQSQLPRLGAGGLNAGATPFQPGVKRQRDDEGQTGQGASVAGQKKIRTANNAEGGGNDGQS